jgi:hypothetical protein
MSSSPPLRPLPPHVAVANHKGGIGKTGICQGLAVAAAEAGHRVLAVDMDGQGNLTRRLRARVPTDPVQPQLRVLRLSCLIPAGVRPRASSRRAGTAQGSVVLAIGRGWSGESEGCQWSGHVPPVMAQALGVVVLP